MVTTPPIPPKFTKPEDRRAVKQSTLKVRCRLQDLLDARDMTRTALRQATGLTPAAVKGLCDNLVRRYDVDTIAVLCEYFNCEMGDLFEIIPRDKKQSDSELD